MESLALLGYRYGTMALAPLVPLALRRRRAKGKEDHSRIRERLGYPSLSRPTGQLIWIHGASIGECLSILPLVSVLLEAPGRSVLVTSGTVDSAKLMGERLPAGGLHQYAPVDTPFATGRFLDYWKPHVAIFVDSEIWPNMLSAAKRRGIGLALVNGRMSAKSFIRWQRLKKMASALLSNYDVCLAQDQDSARRLRDLGAVSVTISGNLKADAPPLPADAQTLASLQHAIGDRPVLLAASTHPGEEDIILPVHDHLQRKLPNLLTVIAPRHPERGASIATLCGERANARRAAGIWPTKETAVYIADTVGELGLLYRIAPAFAFVGGSLVKHGGQNPLEPARLACGVLAGPHTWNFASAYNAIFTAQGAGMVGSTGEMAALAARLLADPAEARALGAAAKVAAESLGGAVERTRSAIEQLLRGNAYA